MTASSQAGYVAHYTRILTDLGVLDTAGAISGLGLWLLLASLAPATTGQQRAHLEDLLGADAPALQEMAQQLLASPHPAVRTALAAWSKADLVDTGKWNSLVNVLPSTVTCSFLPTQQGVDQWAAEATAGLVPSFPLKIDEDTALVLASALASQVTWVTPFQEPENDSLPGRIPHMENPQAQRLFVNEDAGRRKLFAAAGHEVFITQTNAAGWVGAYVARSLEGLAVVSVIADRQTSPAQVHAAALEVADLWLSGRADLSLSAVPLGEGPAWEVTSGRYEVSGAIEGDLVSIINTSLPAWQVDTTWDVKTAPGVPEVLPAFSSAVLEQPAQTCAKQAVHAEFTREGFAAAAVTAFGAAPAGLPPRHVEVETLSATLFFSHPYAVIAVCEPDGSAWSGMPVFSAWVDVVPAREPESEAPDSFDLSSFEGFLASIADSLTDSFVRPETPVSSEQVFSTEDPFAPRDRWPTVSLPSSKFAAPIELAEAEALRSLLRRTHDRFGGFYLPLHPLGSTCSSLGCRTLSRVQADLFTSTGLSAAFPFTLDYEALEHYAATVLWSLLGDAGDEEDLVKFARPTAGLGFCSEVVALVLPDTANAFLQPLVELAVPVHPVNLVALQAAEPTSQYTPIVDAVSLTQAAAVALGETELLSAKFTTASTWSSDLPVHHLELGQGMSATGSGDLPVRVGGSNPVIALPFGPRRNWSDPESTQHLVKLVVDGSSGNTDLAAAVSFAQELPCGHHAFQHLDGLLDSWTDPNSASAVLPTGQYLADVRVTVFCPAAAPASSSAGLGQLSQMSIAGVVDDAQLLVNRVGRRLYWSVRLRVELACEDVFHSEANGGPEAFTTFVNVVFPDTGSDIALGQVLSVTGLPVVTVFEAHQGSATFEL